MSFFADLMTRVRALFLRRREERELDEELDFHLSMEEEYRRRHGESHAEAHRTARMALGGVEQVKEDVRDARGTRLLEDGVSDFRFALRTLRRTPGFAFIAIATLAVSADAASAATSSKPPTRARSYTMSNTMISGYSLTARPANGIIMRDGGICDPIRHMGC